MQPECRALLLDALEAARSIVGIRDEHGPERLRSCPLVRAAVERHLITVGEAIGRACRVEEAIEARIEHAHAIVGLRNRLVHGYAAIRWLRVVMVVEADLDSLVATLESLVD